MTPEFRPDVVDKVEVERTSRRRVRSTANERADRDHRRQQQDRFRWRRRGRSQSTGSASASPNAPRAASVVADVVDDAAEARSRGRRRSPAPRPRRRARGRGPRGGRRPSRRSACHARTSRRRSRSGRRRRRTARRESAGAAKITAAKATTPTTAPSAATRCGVGAAGQPARREPEPDAAARREHRGQRRRRADRQMQDLAAIGLEQNVLHAEAGGAERGRDETPPRAPDPSRKRSRPSPKAGARRVRRLQRGAARLLLPERDAVERPS